MKKTKERAVRMAMMILALLVGITGAVTASGAAEDPAEFPTRAISYVIPFNPGGQSGLKGMT